MLNFLAQEPTITPIVNSTSFPSMRFANIGVLVSIVAPILIIGAALVFGGMMVMVAWRVLNAKGNAEEIGKAQGTAMFAVIGIVVVIAAYLIIKLLEFILGVDFPI
ncbi:hypothetical protein A3A93_01820 [Candidatus Roizmanbacteria bacterium RIFCSPLOWO2_01_FULL_38_12]|uniref:Uncharacterized protein n=1 Tax=Candidatus Roizmanbacteria bacterium RIFCSPLOWO2_01_FULL_38_12 TaxID=1802061 RepID=A0A1F7IYB2_9BACT|nr:MAG: hypothetical protein A2861_02175 [Candidatus Roizmanbacteria bacterium RIFCSPHIGHO2_01_FULL_38_15]OGK34525.1 MAG: hypothetical protein A3F59_04350 [Candidatus Roizmanbacteria bacterium RIFCSPHIGHO2_12_FULL_38_13]OGK48354.1 MAG: hypothetical protein A3A93_01820 [Candidatus Roizmanbacteria bacterium RIFCSPLOWO2_01_FULL_38_12]